MNENETQVQHTPGPWKTGAFGFDVVDVSGFEVATACETSVLTGWGDTGARHWSDRPGETYIDRPEAEAEANARLIAAAPDLLAAARVVLDGLNARIDAADGSDVPVFAGIADLSDAIAKATGTDDR